MNENDILKHLYDKEITCPVCGNKFKVKVTKVNSPRIASKDSDFFINYKNINPYFYDVWLCNNCGYSALKIDFPNIRSFQKDLVKNTITIKWTKKDFPEIFNVDDAIKRYKLALITAVTIKSRNSIQAMILLKIAWMYRIKKDSEKEKLFLKDSAEAFFKAYNLEDFPIQGMNRDSINYLLGELNRRIGNKEEALKWYSQVFNNPKSTQRIRNLTRDGIYIIKHNSK